MMTFKSVDVTINDHDMYIDDHKTGEQLAVFYNFDFDADREEGLNDGQGA